MLRIGESKWVACIDLTTSMNFLLHFYSWFSPERVHMGRKRPASHLWELMLSTYSIVKVLCANPLHAPHRDPNFMKLKEVIIYKTIHDICNIEPFNRRIMGGYLPNLNGFDNFGGRAAETSITEPWPPRPKRQDVRSNGPRGPSGENDRCRRTSSTTTK